MRTRMLLASVLAVGASSFAGCGDGDCPATVNAQESCSATGLSCTSAGASCTCLNGAWACNIDLPLQMPHDLATHDLATHDLAQPSD
ncbi:MAG TPA: hypothetical protein VF997_17765 [Polyangia bacterium]